tara:strand:- start:55 stop:255 length:201 start_codon:yes stop_codon:yes gene_type:complete
MIDKLLKLLKSFMPNQIKNKFANAKISERIDEKGRKILVVDNLDNPDYRAADHWDEIREIERKNGN